MNIIGVNISRNPKAYLEKHQLIEVLICTLNNYDESVMNKFRLNIDDKRDCNSAHLLRTELFASSVNSLKIESTFFQSSNYFESNFQILFFIFQRKMISRFLCVCTLNILALNISGSHKYTTLL